MLWLDESGKSIEILALMSLIGPTMGTEVALRHTRWKRPFDLIVVALSFVPVVILSACVAALVAFRLGRPLFFIQERPGLGGLPFRMWKFRTMRNGDGDDATRLEPFGRWLRSTSLDEIPEWWNVVRGDMSWVGPRPLLLEYVPLFDAEQARRMAVRPGITGWAQVNGRNRISWPERLALDAWYVDHMSLKLDLAILARTIVTVLRRDDVTHAGEATMERFRGTHGK